MAARIDRAGFGVDLDRIEDVFFDLFGRPCFVECKRLHSRSKLQTRIDEAAKQIGRRCNDSQSSKARGIIALDVSKIENSGSLLLPCQTEDQVPREVKQHLHAFVILHKSTPESVREKRVLGIYVYLHMPAAILRPIGFRIGKSAVVQILHGPKTKDGQLALKFLRRIQDSEDP